MKRDFNCKTWMIRFFLFLTLFGLITASYAIASTKLADLTQNIVNLSKAGPDNKMSPDQLKAAIKIAQERRNLLVKESKINPSSIYPFLLTKQITSKLPNEIRSFVEEDVDNIKGVLEINSALMINQQETMEYILTTKDNIIYHLHFSGSRPENLQTGQTLLIKHGFNLVDQNGFNQLTVTADQVVITQQLTAQAMPDAFGPQKTIVIMINFQDAPTNKPFTSAEVSTMTFTNVTNMYMEASSQQSSLVGTVVGWYTVPLNSTSTCDTVRSTIPGLADTAAKNAGVDLSPYIHRVYLFPNVAACGNLGGTGTVGRVGAYNKVLLNGYNRLSITAHEIGHNMGMQHSHSLECSNGTSNTGTCTQVDYGDKADTMGIGNGPHFNAFQKELLGWLNYKVSPPIQTVTTSGTYNIDAFETQNQNVKALKILKRAGTTQYYYIEFRQPIGFDKVLDCGSGCDFTKGVVVHQGDTSNIDSSEILDMSPTDTNKSTIVALLPGKTFEDPDAPNGGVRIKLNSISTTQANVTVTYNIAPPPPPCVHANPTLSISPNTTQYVKAGSSASYVLTIKNNDNSTCTNSAFEFSTTAQPRIEATLAAKTISLNPGQTGTVGLNLVTSTAALPAVYTVGITTVSTTNTANQAVVNASIGVQ